MIKHFALVFFLFFYLCTQVFSQEVLEATRTTEKMVIDGKFTESSWQQIDDLSEFIQKSPNPGKPASQKSSIKILYDDKAIYIGASLFDTNAQGILKELSQRDEHSRANADYFSVYFDSFNDDQNGYSFGVTAANVQSDSRYSPSTSGRSDSNWDAVWESEVSITEEGWFVEMRIPYFALRFPKAEVQQWGFTSSRTIRRIREESYSNFINPNLNGFVNQWGSLTGMKKINPPLRLSFNPFVSTNLSKYGNDKTNAAFNAGMDVKYGINESFTLDLTLIPDFGGVVSDEQQLNLSPFEQEFEENRAFFTEGTELFGKNNLVYSRRIGQRPMDYYKAYEGLGTNEIVEENPLKSKLINATKISGRTKTNWGLGFFNALVNRSEAVIVDTITHTERKVRTGELTNYNILVAEKALQNASSVWLINTNVERANDGRDANVTGIGTRIRSKDKGFEMTSQLSYSQLYTQLSNTKKRTSGLSGEIELERITDDWIYGVGTKFIDDQFDRNDLGLLFSNNEVTQFASLAFRKNQATKAYRFIRSELTVEREQLFKPTTENGYKVIFRSMYVLPNFIGLSLDLFSAPGGTKDFFEPRVFDFETYFQRPSRTFIETSASTDYRKRIAFDFGIERGFGNDYIPINVWNYKIEPRFRVNNQLFFKSAYGFSNQQNNAGYVTTIDDDIIFGLRDRIKQTTSLNADYKFDENMNISLIGRYVWDKVNYNTFYDLDRTNGKLTYQRQFTPEERPNDVNFSAFNLDMIYRWRFAPGSDIIAVYKKQVSERINMTRDDYFSNFSSLMEQPQGDAINIKVIYFFDFNRLRRH